MNLSFVRILIKFYSRPKYAENVSTSDSEDSGDELRLKNKELLSKLAKDRNSMAFTMGKNADTIFSGESDEEEMVTRVEESEDDDDIRMKIKSDKEQNDSETTNVRQPAVLDRRMQRLMQYKHQERDEEPVRRVAKPEIIKSKNQEQTDEQEQSDEEIARPRRHREVIDAEAYDDTENEDQNVERRHEMLRQLKEQENDKAKENPQVDSEEEDEEEDEESEYDEDYEDSEEDIGVPRLKPVFVPKNKRSTIIEKELEEEARLAKLEAEKLQAAEERRKETLKLIEEERRREEEEEAKAKVQAEEEAIIRGIAAMLTDDEDEEVAFELWKVRELKRIKRDHDAEEEREKELREVERLRNMTEEERMAELERNPRKITNKSKKGKYKFMQKYFHRGAFYLDKEDEIFTRDFAQPTLEDHFDKSSLPTILQVKNFGRSGRTKYTHLVDQDTTDPSQFKKNRPGTSGTNSSSGSSDQYRGKK